MMLRETQRLLGDPWAKGGEMRFRSKNILICMGLLGVMLTPLQAKEAQIATRFTGVLIQAASCSIEGNTTPILVLFGNDVITTRVNGQNYMQNIDYKLKCSSNSSAGMRFQIKGTATQFSGRQVLDAGNNGLGIALYRNGGQMDPNQWYNFNYPNLPRLSAAPIKRNNANLTLGRFAVTSTLIIEYQ